MAARPRNRNWIWFFVILGFLAASAITISTVYNLRQQLTLDELTRNRTLWEEKGPRSYVLEYTKTLAKKEIFVVTVRNGAVESVTLKPADAPADQQPTKLEPRSFAYYGMNALFRDIEEFLKMDAEPGSPRAFNRATFDPGDGHLLGYLRSVSKTGQHVQIEITRLEPLPN